VSKGSYYHQLLTEPDKYIFVMILLKKNSLSNEMKLKVLQIFPNTNGNQAEKYTLIRSAVLE